MVGGPASTDGTADPVRGGGTHNEMSGTAGQSVQAGSIGSVHFHSTVPPVVTPHQLEPAPVHFTNRVREVGELDRAFGQSGAQPLILVLSGAGGIGKTALAVKWLSNLRDRFPDGQLQVNLGGFALGGEVATGEVLGRFLRGLGVPPANVPLNEEEQAALYRSMTADKRLLVLLDNAGSVAQVRPLLPASPHSLVVVTSRRRLSPLLASGAQLVSLDPLVVEDGVAMLAKVLGAERVTSEAPFAQQLVGLCDGLPLALSIVSSGLVARPRRTLARLATELADVRRRLAVLSSGEELSVNSVFDLSYQALPDEAARLYRLLGVCPGSEFGIGAAAATMDSSVSWVEDLLGVLVDASLLEESGEDRYRFHDLVRLHARERAEAEDTDEQRRAALRRVLEWYLHAASATRFLTTPDQELSEHDFVYTPADPVSFADRTEALDWLEWERPNLIAAVKAAEEHAMPALGWRLADAMWPLFLLHKHYRDFLEVSHIGVRCAREWGDRWAEAIMRNRCGAACRGAGRFDEAREHYAGALAVLPETGDQAPAVRSLEGMGLVALAQGRLEDAIEHFEEDLRRSRAADRHHDVALALINLGVAATRLNRYAEAIEYLEQARELLTEQGDEYNVGRTLIELARLHAKTGEFARARENLTTATDIMRASGSEFEYARAVQTLGDVAALEGNATEARQHFETALPILEALNRPEAAELRRRLG